MISDPQDSGLLGGIREYSKRVTMHCILAQMQNNINQVQNVGCEGPLSLKSPLPDNYCLRVK